MKKDGFNNLYYYSINGNLIKKLTSNTFPVRDIIGANASGNEVYFTATGENPTNMLGYKVTLKGKQTQITKDAGVHNFIPCFDGSYFFDEYSNHTTRSKSLYNKNLKTTTLLESSNKYDGYAMGTAENKNHKAAGRHHQFIHPIDKT